MADHHGARVVSGLAHDPPRERLADAAESRMTEGVLLRVNRHQLTFLRVSAFGDDDDGVARARRVAHGARRVAQTLAQVSVNLPVAERVFRDEDEIGLSGDARPE